MSKENSQNKEQQPPRMDPNVQTVQVALYPIPLHQQIVNAIQELPHRQADPLLQQLAAVQISEINIGPMNG